MNDHYKCRHGLTLTDTCDACEIEAARETDRRYGPIVDAARRLIAATPKDRYIEHFEREGRAQVQEVRA